MPRSRHRKKPSRRRHRPTDTFNEDFEPRFGIGDALVKLIEPYVPEEPTPEELDKLLSLATVAWNVSLLPETERDREIRRFAREVFPPPRFRLVRLVLNLFVPKRLRGRDYATRIDALMGDIAFERAVHDMVERRLQLFPHL